VVKLRTFGFRSLRYQPARTIISFRIIVIYLALLTITPPITYQCQLWRVQLSNSWRLLETRRKPTCIPRRFSHHTNAGQVLRHTIFLVSPSGSADKRIKSLDSPEVLLPSGVVEKEASLCRIIAGCCTREACQHAIHILSALSSPPSRHTEMYLFIPPPYSIPNAIYSLPQTGIPNGQNSTALPNSPLILS
jgi:hypothetical protein